MTSLITGRYQRLQCILKLSLLKIKGHSDMRIYVHRFWEEESYICVDDRRTC